MGIIAGIYPHQVNASGNTAKVKLVHFTFIVCYRFLAYYPARNIHYSDLSTCVDIRYYHIDHTLCRVRVYLELMAVISDRFRNRPSMGQGGRLYARSGGQILHLS
ncbi:MAG: hypothetical protein K0Q79_2090 [Flavipsychrobacter sp.]|nr:hypothetical protein [Flavipsychrobacter sp.]